VGQALNINIMDKTGTMERIFTATEVKYGTYQPGDTATVRHTIPLRPRFKPPAITPRTWQGERYGSGTHYRATISLVNAYESDIPFPAGTKIKALRIIHPTGKPWGAGVSNEPRMGYADGASGRMVLGTVPVEADGSAYFEAPVGLEIYFQALDSLGMAVQSMRSGTFVHPGEQMSCRGCHEDKWKAIPPPTQTPLAFKRQASPMTPEPTGSLPLTFSRLVMPVLRGECQPCHQSRNVTTVDFSSYNALEKWAFYFHGSSTALTLTQDHGGTRTIPGYFGARQSLMGKALLKTHIPEKRVSADGLRRVIVWLDANSQELASFKNPDAQRAYPQTRVIWPEIDVDSTNPTGVEKNRPLPSVDTSLHSALNVALGAPVVASSSQPQGPDPAVITDGATGGSYWSADPYPQWVIITLPALARIDSLQVNTYVDGTRYYQYKIEISLDKSSWTQVVDMSANTQPATLQGVSHAITPANARYIRVTMLRNSANTGVHLYEVKAFGSFLTPAVAAVSVQARRSLLIACGPRQVTIEVNGPAAHVLRIFTVDGRLARSYAGKGFAAYRHTRQDLGPGVYLACLRSGARQVSRIFVVR
jgi:hypothetical protein